MNCARNEVDITPSLVENRRENCKSIIQMGGPEAKMTTDEVETCFIGMKNLVQYKQSWA